MTNRYARHDSIYDRDYFLREVDPAATAAAPVFQELLTADFPASRVVDVGCGTGALLQALARAGHECTGLEYAEAALSICRDRGLRVTKHDLENDTWPNAARFDVAVSVEVAEHLPPGTAGRFVDLLTKLAPNIVFSAAVEGQGGRNHVNERPPSYWITLFRARGCELDEELTRRWRGHLMNAEVADWYSRNLMVFRATPYPAG